MKIRMIGEATFFKVAFFIVFILLWANVKSDTIKNYVEVKNEKIYLSDILVTDNQELKNYSETIEIARSPEPGEQKVIDGNYINIKLKQSKIKVEKSDIPEKIIIKREQYRDLSRDIKSKINEKLEEIYCEKGIAYEFKSSDDTIEIPEGEYEVKIEDNKVLEGVEGKFYTYVEIIFQEKVYKKINIFLKVGKQSKVYVLTDNVSRGEKFSYLKMELKDTILEENEEYITEENSFEYEKKIYKGVIKKGEMLKPKNFTSIKIFKQNSRVKAVIEESGISIIYIVKAMEDGYLGESVKMLNEKSKKIITGIVQENGSVKINSESF